MEVCSEKLLATWSRNITISISPGSYSLPQYLESNCFLQKCRGTLASQSILRLEGNLQVIHPKPLKQYFHNFSYSIDLVADHVTIPEIRSLSYFSTPLTPCLARGLSVPLPGGGQYTSILSNSRVACLLLFLVNETHVYTNVTSEPWL